MSACSCESDDINDGNFLYYHFHRVWRKNLIYILETKVMSKKIKSLLLRGREKNKHASTNDTSIMAV